MAQPKLTRSPAVTYTWMAASILVVIVLFRRWDMLGNSRQRNQWWLILGAFLLADYLFLIVPIRDTRAIRRLSRAGKLWGLLAWVSVAGFVYAAMAGARLRGTLLENVEISSLGLLLLAILACAIFRLSKEWIREPLRSIVARADGGFLVHYHADPEIAAALSAIPGAQAQASQLDSDSERGRLQDWSVPASAASAAALLQFAKRFDFDFVPQKSAGQNSVLEKELARGR